mmetsp:Transcript_23780/g.39869  ORF Transcript_23780/g.39869 Transcript_23780/m.39869 type:complete len:206 (-) Transcript_23780:429-1046(-)
MLAVEVRSLARAEEELGPVGARPGVGHGQAPRSRVRELKALVLKLLAVDGLATRAVASGEVATLAHESRDDAMELASLEMQWLAHLALALLPRAQRSEVLCGLGDAVRKQLHHHPPRSLAADRHVEEHLGVVGAQGIPGRPLGLCLLGRLGRCARQPRRQTRAHGRLLRRLHRLHLRLGCLERVADLLVLRLQLRSGQQIGLGVV